MNVTLLGPQRRVGAARAAVAELMPSGQIATVNAGWQQRENDSAELSDVLGGRMVNLELHRRWQEIVDADADYARAERRLTALLAEIQAVYAIRLNSLMSSLEAISRRGEVPAVQTAAMFDTLRELKELDRWHLRVVAETRSDFFDAVRLGERDNVQASRAEVAQLVADCSGMVFAGGHVGVLLHVLHIFHLSRVIRPPVIAWSAGAMALSDRVVLFHDYAPRGERHAELYAEGLGTYQRVLPFPHARRRLRLDDASRMGQLARRLDPRECVLLADGARLDVREGEPLPSGTRVLSRTGGIWTVDGDPS
ncbi:MAG TPA: hypothetical protein VEQ66_00275 [Propionibacteriaceae bacterium]|nr:hypothetical protein [Propionibacteriaceae bacterium]